MCPVPSAIAYHLAKPPNRTQLSQRKNCGVHTFTRGAIRWNSQQRELVDLLLLLWCWCWNGSTPVVAVAVVVNGSAPVVAVAVVVACCCHCGVVLLLLLHCGSWLQFFNCCCCCGSCCGNCCSREALLKWFRTAEWRCYCCCTVVVGSCCFNWAPTLKNHISATGSPNLAVLGSLESS